jgi:hypothetical protein
MPLTLPFVIPSVPGFPPSPLSLAATYVVLSKENRMQPTEAATIDRKFGEAEGSAFLRISHGNVLDSRGRKRTVPFTKPSAAHPLGNYRFSTAVYFTGYSAPIYSARGRINRLSSSCSITCAAQPEILLTAKIGVNKSRSIPSMVYVEAE